MPLGNPNLDYNTNPQSPGYKGPFPHRDQKPPKPGPGYVWNQNDRKWYLPKPTGGRKPVGTSPGNWAQQQAQRMIDAQIAAITKQQEIYLTGQRQEQQRAMDRAAAMYAALMGQNAAGGIQGAYSGAANQIMGTASGLGNTMEAGADQSAATDNRILSGSGQEARNEGDAMNEVFTNAYGIIPGSALDKIGRAYAGDAAAQPRFNLQEGLLNAVRDNTPDISEYQMKIAELTGTKPELVQKFLEQKQSLLDNKLKRKWAIQDRKQEMKDRAWERKQQKIQDMRDWYIDQAKLQMSQGNYERAQAYYALAVQREDRMGQKQAFDQQWKIDHPNGTSKADKPEWGDIQADIADDAGKLTMEVMVKDPQRPYAPATKKTVPLPYQKAFTLLLQKYGGMVKDKARLRKIINKILAAHGIRPKAELYGPHGQGDHSYDVPRPQIGGHP